MEQLDVVEEFEQLNLPAEHLELLSRLTSDSEIAPDRARTLRALFETALRSPRFCGDSTRLDRLEDALKVPVTDNRAYNCCYANAEEFLYAAAAKVSARTGSTVVTPTEVEIHADAYRRYMRAQGIARKKSIASSTPSSL